MSRQRSCEHRRDEPDEPDGAAHGHARADADRGGRHDQEPGAREIDAERPKAIIGIAFEFGTIAVFALFWVSIISALPAEARRILGYEGTLPSIVGASISCSGVSIRVEVSGRSRVIS